MAVSASGPSDRLTLQLRRLIDETTPGRPPFAVDSERRLQSRYTRVLPMLFVPFRGGKPALDESAFVISRDLSDRGICIIQNEGVEFDEVVIGLWYTSENNSPYSNEPIFFVGKIRSNESLGGGFWQSGVEIQSLYSDSCYLDGLRVMAKGLIPLPLLNAEDRKLVTAGG